MGDDDQNIYAFNGSSVEFIRRFEADYGATPAFLTDNYRSTSHIVAAANAVIEPARERMKIGYPIAIDRIRAKLPAGGRWTALDPVARGKVQLLLGGDDPIAQAQVAVAELQRLSGLDSSWEWSACAVVARDWSYLDPVRSVCERHDIPVEMANEDFSGFWHLRETRALRDWLDQQDSPLVRSGDLATWLRTQPPGPWVTLLEEAVAEYALETSARQKRRLPISSNGWLSGAVSFVGGRAACC